MSQASAEKKTAKAGAGNRATHTGVDDDMGQLLRRAEKLDPERHKDLRVASGKDFQFVSGLHTIPLSAVEFMPSARHYPIIFAGDQDVFPVALLGLQPGENLFVNAKGRWKEGCYVPAILRRAHLLNRPDPAGVQLFTDTGCAACHIPGLLPEDGPGVIMAYTDLALHDMGPGLDDGLPEGDAASSEWRTAPLWGLGTYLADNPSGPLLHDGRARGLLEAILWHDGEAAAARDAFLASDAEVRARLIDFLMSL